MIPSRMLCPLLDRRKRSLLFLLTVITGGVALKDVSVVVPQAANIGGTVTLQCHYDLEGEPLYTLKWYKGSREFYRYIPKELPSTQVFPYQDIDVDLAKSNQNSIVLRNLLPDQTGRYRCEVSTDAPNFYTHIMTGYMFVISIPSKTPAVLIEKDSYEIGYTLRGNCTSPPSFPAINLTWFVNGKKVNESFQTHLPDPRAESDSRRKPVTTVVGLEHEIDSNTFQGGKAHIKCEAKLFNVYHTFEEIVLEEERPRPRPSSVLGTRDSASGCATPATMVLMNMGVLLALIMR